MRQREAKAADVDARIARDKAATCKEYSHRLDNIRERERRGGGARTMEHLSEMRRRIQAAQFSKGC